MRPDVQVRLVIFRDRAADPLRIDLSAAGLDEFIARLAGIEYDGGTQMGSIAPFVRDTDLVLLFADGISTFGVSEPGGLAAPVYAVNSSTVSDGSFLTSLARRTGGRYLNLKRVTTEDAVAAVGRPAFSFLSATVEAGKVVEVCPGTPEPADGRFLLTGVLSGGEARVTLNFGVRRVTHSETFTVSASDAVEGDLLRRFWAQEKLRALLVARKENEHEIVDLGRRHGLVTPFTSLIVLETLDQYLEHEILPPATLAKMRERYIEVVEGRRREAEQIAESKLERIVLLWQARVKWWEKKYEVPPNFKYRSTEGKSQGPADGAPTPSASPGAPAPEEESTGESAGGGEGMGDGPGAGGFSFGEPVENGDEESDPSAQPGVVLKSWDPKTPYLAALKAAPKPGRFAVYMAAKEKYGGSPAFFLDCADFFIRQSDESLGIQILSNIAEMELDSAPLLRILGHRLEQLGALDLSVLAFTEAKALRPEEPQSWRDLGLVLAKRGSREDLERAVELLYHVVLNEWDRFDEIELLTLMELNQVIPQARAAGVANIPVDARLVKPLPLDIYTNYGKPNQKVRSMTLRLTGEKDSFVVGEIEF